MLANQDIQQGHIGRRLNRAVGAIAIAAGLTVTGMSATTTHADDVATTTLALHNTTTGANDASGSYDCLPDYLDSTTSYWHFVVSSSDYSFVSITLHLSPPDTTTTYTASSSGVVFNGKQAYIPVPAGASLTSLQADSTAVITPQVVEGAVQPLFNLSHTCSAVMTEETTPPTEATTPATEATTAPTQATTPATEATTPATQATTPASVLPAAVSTTTSEVASEAPIVLPTTAVAPQVVSLPADDTLPVTGSNTASGIAIGVAMVGAGLILSGLARRRSARANV